jgi:hypothetical protein
MWKSACKILKNLKLELPYNSAILFMGIYKSRHNRDICTPMFIEALFTIFKLWNQPRCPSADE